MNRQHSANDAPQYTCSNTRQSAQQFSLTRSRKETNQIGIISREGENETFKTLLRWPEDRGAAIMTKIVAVNNKLIV